MQVTNSTTPVLSGNPEVNSIVAIITAVAAIVGTIGGVLMAYKRTNAVGQVATMGAQKAVENTGNIAAALNAILAASPELAAKLADPQVSRVLAEAQKRAETAEAQLAVLKPKVPASAQADNVKELPTESKPSFKK